MNVEDFYSATIDALWKEKVDTMPESIGKEIAKRGYFVESDLPHDDVLFIGMNPSYNEDSDKPENLFYKVEWGKNSFFDEILKFSMKTRGYDNPSHHDLLFVRHKTQKDIEALIEHPDFKDFYDMQLSISADIIKKLSPKLIVILNAGACKQFSKIFERTSNKIIEEDLGAYPFMINEVTPVLFSSMLSGARPLDCGSRDSLSWHINYILNKIEKGR